VIYLWLGFGIFILVMLALDLGVFHRKAHQTSVKEALVWSGIWITLAMAFNLGIYFFLGSQKAVEFLTGYLIEKSLGVDNIFVFLLIFSYFKVPSKYQHKVLFWGVLGALAMRALFIAAGLSLIERFHWLIYLFGAFLVFTGIRLATRKDTGINPERNPVVKFFRRMIPVTETYQQDHFFIRRAGRYFATPLFVVLLVVETTDLVFAIDSIPAIMAITLDPFIVYTSNAFAILGLRAMYFGLAGLLGLFYYLRHGLATILIFVGAKMLVTDLYEIPVGIALGVVAAILASSIIASVKKPPKHEKGRKSA